MTVQILHKRSAVEFKNANGGQLEFGEIALNYHESGPFLQCKDSAGEIINLGGVFLTEDAGDAPGDPLPGRMWLRGETLFIWDGDNWIGIAGTGGGGGGGGGGLTSIIGGDGINEVTTGGTVTLTADIDTTQGMAFVSGNIAVNLGTGLQFDANGAIEVDPDFVGDVPTVNDGKLQFLDADGEVQYEFTANQAGDTQITLSDDGGVGSATDLNVTERTATTLDIESSTGADARVPFATDTLAGLMTAADKNKLDNLGDGEINIAGGDGITATGDNATANQSGNTTRTLAVKTGDGLKIDDNGNVIIDPDHNLDGNVNLPTVGNAELTLKKADGSLIPGSFTANQQTAGSITLPDYIEDAGVTKIVAGTGIAIVPTAGTGDVTISSTVEGLEFAGNVNVTDETTIPVVRSANQLYVNIGQGTFHADWAALTNNASTTSEANPGDFMLLDTNTEDDDPWTWIEGGTPPSSDGTWVDDGDGNLYPANTANSVLVGTTSNFNGDLVQIEENSGNNLSIRRNTNAQLAPSNILLSRSRGTENGSFTALIKDDWIGQISFEGADGSADISAASISAQVDGTTGTKDMPSRLVFGTTADSKSSPTERMRINSGGNVGIGTDAPGARLHVQGSNSNSLIAKFGANHAAPERAFELNEFEVNGVNSTGFQFNAPGVVDTGLGAAISLATIGVDRLYVNYLGNVGIGTTSPSVNLEVSSDLPWFRLTDSDDASTCDLLNNGGKLSIRADEGKKSSSSYIDIRVQADEKMRIKSNGNVGIGTTDPQAKLDVRGGNAYVMPLGVTPWQSDEEEQNSGLYLGSDGRINAYRLSDDTQSPLQFITVNKTKGARSTDLCLTKDGNVGIGTVEQDGKLDVVFNGDNAIVTRREADSHQNISIGCSVNGNRIISNYPSSNAKPFTVWINDADETDNAEVHCMTLNPDGYAGFGNSSRSKDPRYPFVVNATNTREFVVGQGLNSNYVMIGAKNINNNAYLQIESYATTFHVEGVPDAMQIAHTTGNVGIGVTDADHKLEVNGDLKATNYRIDLLEELS